MRQSSRTKPPTDEQRARRVQRRAERKRLGITTSNVPHQMRHATNAKASKKRREYDR